MSCLETSRVAWTTLASAVVGGYVCLHLLGRIRVTAAVDRARCRLLGTGKNADDGGDDRGRRLGLLERWYVAHSRDGTHTGFVLCLELEKEQQAAAANATAAGLGDDMRRRIVQVVQ
jgi:hypothetical protein